MDNSNNSSDQDKIKAETLENADERSRYFTGQQIQQTTREGQNKAELINDVVGAAVDSLEAYSELNTESVDLRGQPTPDGSQQTQNYGQVVDGLAITATAGVLAAQKTAQLIQEKQEANYSQTTEAQVADQNQVLQDVVKDDKQQQTEYEQEQQEALEANLDAQQGFEQSHTLESTHDGDLHIDNQNQVLQEVTENDVQQYSEYGQEQLTALEASLDYQQDTDHSHNYDSSYDSSL